MASIPDIIFKKVTDKIGTFFNQSVFYEENFEKINQQIIPKVNELDSKLADIEAVVDKYPINVGTLKSFEVLTENPTGDDLFDGRVWILSIPNTPPLALDLEIVGSASVGSVLEGSYIYYDNDFDLEGTSTFKWYSGISYDGIDKVEIIGANQKTYIITEAETDKFIFFEVTPVSISGTTIGNSEISQPSTKVIDSISLFEDFNDNIFDTEKYDVVLNNGTYSTSGWSEINNRLEVQNAPESIFHTKSFVEHKGVEFEYSTNNNKRVLQSLIRMTNKDSFYMMHFDQGASVIKLYRANNGSFVDIKQSIVTIPSGSKTFKFEAMNDEYGNVVLTAYINGEQVTTFIDSSVDKIIDTNLRVGLRNSWTTTTGLLTTDIQTVDNLKVYIG